MRFAPAYWNDATPVGETIDQLLYRLRRADAEDGLIYDAVTITDLLELADEPFWLDALITTGSQLPRKVETMEKVMNAASGELQVAARTISDPFKKNGVINVAVIFELSDGQTVSAVFHNPDAKNVKSLKPGDDLISWKWLLNKRDVTIAVAPEKGTDLPIRMVARRLMALAAKNSAAFGRLNQKRAARLANIAGLKTEIKELETELDGLTKEIEIERLAADERAMQRAQSVSAATAQAMANQGRFVELTRQAEGASFAVGSPNWYGVIDDPQGELPDDFMPETGNKLIAKDMGALAAEHGEAYAMQINVNKDNPFRLIKVLHPDGRGVGSQWAATPQDAFAMLAAEPPAAQPEPVAEPEPARPAPSTPLVINGNPYTEINLDPASAQAAMDAALERQAGDHAAAAKDVYKNTLQGRYVQTKIGPVLITGSGWQELKQGLKQDEIRARTIPFIPVILRDGEVGAPEDLYKARTDGTIRFHPFNATVDLSDVTVRALLKVAEREDHTLVYHLRADEVFDSAQSQNPPEGGFDRDAVFRGSGVPSEPTTKPESTSAPLLTVMDSVGQDGSVFNLVILEVIDKATGQRLTELEDVTAPVITLTGQELGDFPDTPEGLKALRDAADVAYNKLMEDNPWVPCPDLGEDVELRTKGRKKVRSLSADKRKLMIIPSLRALIGQAKKLGPEKPNYDQANSQNILGYQTMRSLVKLADEPLAVRFVFARDDKGRYHYDHTIHERDIVLDSANENGPAVADPLETMGGSRGCTRDLRAASEPCRLLPAELSAEHRLGVMLSRIPNPGFSPDLNLDQVGEEGKGGRLVLNLFIEGEEPEAVAEEPDEDAPQPEPPNPTIARVDAAYPFESATDAFKQWVAESVDQPDYSPFATAKAMEERAKANGARIEWDLYGGAVLDSAMEEEEEEDEPDDDEDDENEGLDPNTLPLFDDAQMDSDPAPILDSNPGWAKQPRDRKTGQWRLRRARKIKEAVTGLIDKALAAARRGSHALVHRAALDAVADDLQALALDAAGDGTQFVGVIRKGGTIVGRVDIGDDGKAMVFVGASGGERVKAPSGVEAVYSDDDAADMVEWVLAGAGVTKSLAAPLAPDELTLENVAEALRTLGWDARVEDGQLLANPTKIPEFEPGKYFKTPAEVEMDMDDLTRDYNGKTATDAAWAIVDEHEAPDGEAYEAYLEAIGIAPATVPESWDFENPGSMPSVEFIASIKKLLSVVQIYGLSLNFGDFNDSLSGGLFDSAVPVPETLRYGFFAQVVKDGQGIGRAWGDEDGGILLYAGLSGETPVAIDGQAAFSTASTREMAQQVEALMGGSSVVVEPPADPEHVPEPEPAPEEPKQKTAFAVSQDVIRLLQYDKYFSETMDRILTPANGMTPKARKTLKDFPEFGAATSYGNSSGMQVTFGVTSMAEIETNGVTLIARQGRNETRIQIDKTSVPGSVAAQVVNWFKGLEKASDDAFTASLAPSPDLDDPLVQETLELFKAGTFNQMAATADGSRTPEVDAAYTKAAKAFLEGDMAVAVKPKKADLIAFSSLDPDANIDPKPVDKTIKAATKPQEEFDAVMKMAADKDVRYYLEGVKVEEGRLIACNGHRLIAYQTDTSAWQDIELPKNGKGVPSEDRIIGKDGKALYGRYPDIERIMRARAATDLEVEVDAKKLAARLRGVLKAQKMTNDSKWPAVWLRFGEQKYWTLVVSTYLLDMAEAFLRLGRKTFIMNLAGPNVSIMAWTTDGRLKQVIMPQRDTGHARDVFKPIGDEVLVESAPAAAVEPEPVPELQPEPVPVPEPQPMPEPTTTEDPQKAADRALFQSVIDGLSDEEITADLMDRMIAAYERWPGDAEMEDLATRATEAYQAQSDAIEAAAGI